MVYVHSAICANFFCIVVFHTLWSIGEGPSALSICAFCYMLKHIWCSGIPYIYGQNGGEVYLP